MEANKIFFIADDDPDDREIFIEALHGIDELCKCITATDGQEAISKLTNGMTHLPDFIFLDLNMPRMNGKECLAEIKKNSKLRKIPVIIYSTSTDKKDIQETMELGAAFFLQKPNRFDDLSRALANIISKNWE